MGLLTSKLHKCSNYPRQAQLGDQELAIFPGAVELYRYILDTAFCFFGYFCKYKKVVDSNFSKFSFSSCWSKAFCEINLINKLDEE